MHSCIMQKNTIAREMLRLPGDIDPYHEFFHSTRSFKTIMPSWDIPA